MVYDRKTDKLTHSSFKNLFDFLPKETAVLLNDTRVIKARIFGQKKSGGKVELLLNAPLEDNLYSVYIKGKVKKGSELFFEKKLKATVQELLEDGTRSVTFTCKEKALNNHELFEVLDEIGHVPLPPYIKRDDTAEDLNDYQSVFSKEKGAVAAPTASLHFSEEMFDELQKRYQTEFLTLHVGAGTFKPVDVENIMDHKMHAEFYNIPESTCNLIDSSKKLLAVGTTVTRTVEYYARTTKPCAKSDLFLHPHNPPIRVDHLLTNFHLPKSTLIMLVASFVGIEKTMEIYKSAVGEKYRFFSYGDGMLIL